LEYGIIRGCNTELRRLEYRAKEVGTWNYKGLEYRAKEVGI